MSRRFFKVYMCSKARFGGWPKSISDPLLRKICLFLTFFGLFFASGAERNSFAKNTLKRPKNAIIGPFDKWPTSDFWKSISDPTLGHPPSNRALMCIIALKWQQNFLPMIKLFLSKNHWPKIIKQSFLGYFGQKSYKKSEQTKIYGRRES